MFEIVWESGFDKYNSFYANSSVGESLLETMNRSAVFSFYIVFVLALFSISERFWILNFFLCNIFELHKYTHIHCIDVCVENKDLCIRKDRIYVLGRIPYSTYWNLFNIPLSALTFLWFCHFYQSHNSLAFLEIVHLWNVRWFAPDVKKIRKKM